MKKDAFTQEELTKAERILTAMGLLIGTGAMWRSFADSISTQATKSGLKDVDNIIDTIKKDYSSTIDSKIATRQTNIISKETKQQVKFDDITLIGDYKMNIECILLQIDYLYETNR